MDAERHPVTGAPMCCCLGGREKCDHHTLAAPAVTETADLLDGIRDEVRDAVLEGDAQDCSSADCIADAVYEFVRVRLRGWRPAVTETAGLDAERLNKNYQDLRVAAQQVLDDWNRVGAQSDGYRALRAALDALDAKMKETLT